jgi:hypothetical protein
MFETKDFLVLVYSYKKKWIALINKNSKESFLSEVESFGGILGRKQLGGILNDLDGGIMFQPENYYVENDCEYMISWINPYQLKMHIAGNEFLKSVPKYPEKKKELEKVAASLKETDNPVLMMLRLKK